MIAPEPAASPAAPAAPLSTARRLTLLFIVFMRIDIALSKDVSAGSGDRDGCGTTRGLDGLRGGPGNETLSPTLKLARGELVVADGP